MKGTLKITEGNTYPTTLWDTWMGRKVSHSGSGLDSDLDTTSARREGIPVWGCGIPPVHKREAVELPKYEGTEVKLIIGQGV